MRARLPRAVVHDRDREDGVWDLGRRQREPRALALQGDAESRGGLAQGRARVFHTDQQRSGASRGAHPGAL